MYSDHRADRDRATAADMKLSDESPLHGWQQHEATALRCQYVSGRTVDDMIGMGFFPEEVGLSSACPGPVATP
jgi:hypothetical protein